jgi:hypothetical protein
VDAAGASAWLVGSIDGPISPAMFRLAFRTAFLGTQVALAEWFITSGSADVILDLQALTGGVGMAAMTVFHPVGVGVWFVTQRVAIRRRSQVRLFLFPYGQCE